MANHTTALGTWVLKEKLDLTSAQKLYFIITISDPGSEWQVDFTDGNDRAFHLFYIYEASGFISPIISDGTVAYENDAFAAENHRTLTFTGGNAIADTNLIEWLEANSDVQPAPPEISVECVSPAGVTLATKGKYVPRNVKVTPRLQEKEVTFPPSATEVAPDEGFAGLSKVALSVPASVVDTADATADAACILEYKTAYVNGEKVRGSVPTYYGSVVVNTVLYNDEQIAGLTYNGEKIVRVVGNE